MVSLKMTVSLEDRSSVWMLKSPNITFFLCLDNTSVRYSVIASINMELIMPFWGEDGTLQLYILACFCWLSSMLQPLESDSGKSALEMVRGRTYTLGLGHLLSFPLWKRFGRLEVLC